MPRNYLNVLYVLTVTEKGDHSYPATGLVIAIAIVEEYSSGCLNVCVPEACSEQAEG
jgi:hypothetical protein